MLSQYYQCFQNILKYSHCIQLNVLCVHHRHHYIYISKRHSTKHLLKKSHAEDKTYLGLGDLVIIFINNANSEIHACCLSQMFPMHDVKYVTGVPPAHNAY